MQREYIWGWWKMIKKHHIHLTDALWIASIIVLALSVIGVLALDYKSTPILKIVSIIGLVLILLLWAWHLFIQIPAEMVKEIKEDSKLQIDKMQTDHATDMYKMTPAYNIQLATEKQRHRCLLIRPYKGYVKKDRDIIRIVKFQIQVWSWLFQPITLKHFSGCLQISDGGTQSYNVDFGQDINAVVNGLPYGAEQPITSTITIYPLTQGSEIPANFLDRLCIATFSESGTTKRNTTLVTEEVGEIKPFINVGGFIHLEIDEEVIKLD